MNECRNSYIADTCDSWELIFIVSKCEYCTLITSFNERSVNNRSAFETMKISIHDRCLQCICFVNSCKIILNHDFQILLRYLLERNINFERNKNWLRESLMK